MVVMKAAGILTGGSLAAWWSGTLVASVASGIARNTSEAGNLAQVARPPTLAEVAAAQGTITWLLFVAFALLGAGVWAAQHSTSDPSRKWADRFLRAAVGATGWGIVVAAVELHFGVDPLLVGASCVMAGLLSELLTNGAVKVAGQVAANPLRAWRYYREGKLADLAETDRAERETEVRKTREREVLDETWRRNRKDGPN